MALYGQGFYGLVVMAISFNRRDLTIVSLWQVGVDGLIGRAAGKDIVQLRASADR